MTWNQWYTLALWAIIVAGVIPAGYFVATYRPRQRFTMTQLDASAWVGVILAMYGLSAYNLATGQTEPPAFPVGLVTVAVGLGIDVVLWLRALNWRRIRRAWPPRRRRGDPPPQH